MIELAQQTQREGARPMSELRGDPIFLLAVGRQFCAEMAAFSISIYLRG
jgi:hypothetical protein